MLSVSDELLKARQAKQDSDLALKETTEQLSSLTHDYEALSEEVKALRAEREAVQEMKAHVEQQHQALTDNASQSEQSKLYFVSFRFYSYCIARDMVIDFKSLHFGVSKRSNNTCDLKKQCECDELCMCILHVYQIHTKRCAPTYPHKEVRSLQIDVLHVISPPLIHPPLLSTL